ncbi:N-acetyl-gamma-glutamyl-phosphate reductase [Oceanobacillus iheyensis HTE831]|uniref:N-acetyl-gamma-glutamyl-phosphate reductase n=1 Tax=Oceanobacillus iheyensis (strain DSM 14371 / CIP 107618 / JCM 11309 / KCTC 3954 / HTE831) TaxID=221109 RepID=ARGC_OCEIH|nr:N-acetyl-gamma-glutamyl-phosphate reductase [Oceanobacillus iheyensis]Q8CUN2.1 RecName: Full=N-acetyl-gamma-glutamyl-phosphate reductase; Short=AGPR; AltName: Full=N-acetyl-glutamate semialdehyde dehydrogenase; Short=NAGSA dehydrogenase [Oceanobacillus iheyensis HTE831]BAC13031.1 N-acetyl-gamma-glutamyl-phosphate reductase [Oceanobacillus iheyensis HTE831]
MKKAAIIGGTGYGAIELIRLLDSHPYIELAKIISQSQHGELLDETYPHLATYVTQPMQELHIQQLIEEIDIVFLATPAGVAKEIAASFLDSSIQCIDLSGDLRLSSSDYEMWYQKKPASEALLEKTAYGLTEVFQEKIKQANIISNPGCFPTAALLGLIPMLENNIIESKGIMIDGKTGISGAGKNSSAKTHFSTTNENVTPYKIGTHQHIPEIEKYLSQHVEESSVRVTLTTHLIPMTRGLMCTMYAPLQQDIDTADVIDLYKHYYEQSSFIRIRKQGEYPSTKDVTGSNYCDIGAYVDKRTNQLIISSAIDNLVKGAAGQAIQNINVMNGWDEKTGLSFLPVYP